MPSMQEEVLRMAQAKQALLAQAASAGYAAVRTEKQEHINEEELRGLLDTAV